MIAEHLIVQSASFDFMPWLWHAVARLHTQPRSCHVIQSRLRGDLCPRDQANMWKGISFIDRVAAVFQIKNFFAAKCSLRIRIFHQCRRRVTDQLNDKKTTNVKKKSKQNDLNKKIQIDKIKRRSISIWSKNEIIFELNYSVNDKIWNDK